jgi:hypothetical protein
MMRKRVTSGRQRRGFNHTEEALKDCARQRELIGPEGKQKESKCW